MSKPCPNCDANGYVDNAAGNVDCEMCDGTGEVADDFDPEAAGWWSLEVDRDSS